MPYVDNDIPLATKRKWNHDGPYNKSSQRNISSPEPFHASASPTPTRKTLHPTKRFRSIHQDTDSDIHSSHRQPPSREPSIPCPANNAGRVTSTTLLPCHVCHRRPTKKSDLDSFAKCQACREQTCFICMRECQGRTSYTVSTISKKDEGDHDTLSRSFRMDDADASPSTPHTDTDIDVDIGDDDGGRKRELYTHHSMICSRCCVEKGAEGEVICLGCLSDPYTNTP
ncbi:hypothetical protein CCMA1212_002602 [Trichoderma ghanense]|uniref:Uncharacterized protein n=1 Tax=Trichoderma ghanense TaxID=65468 RepID=A0ABY2HBU6_9HYPO